MKSYSIKLSSLLAAFALVGCLPAKPNDSETKIVDHSHEDLLLTQDKGGVKIAEADYKLDAEVDPLVLASAATDVSGRIYLPPGKGPFPVLVYLHGNHGTCGVPATQDGDPRIDDSIWYTSTGSCDAPSPEEDDGKKRVQSPSHLGYAYSARQLASWGYAVVSVNANRGITAGDGTAEDPGLVAARGALVLKNLATLRSWSEGAAKSPTFSFETGTEDLKGKLDFSEVGLMGHSRGGEGVRYAYNIYQNAAADSVWKKQLPDLKIKAVFEIAPVDFGTTGRAVKVEARGTAWAVLVGGCDRDVSTFMGTGPYARMLQSNDGFPKAVFAVWGANHNFFNTEWQVSDAPHSCYGNQKPLWKLPSLENPPIPNADNAISGVTGSPEQQVFAKALMFAFFRANVGKQVDRSLMDTFDPQYALPKELARITPTSREFVRLQDSQLAASPGATTSKHQEGTITIQPLADKIKADLIELQKYWNTFASDNGIEQITVKYEPDSFVRKSLILESPVLLQDQEVTLPFPSTMTTQDFWTIDATFARRTSCYKYPETDCRLDTSISEIDVALVYENGDASNFVHLTDYITLENFHDNYFEYFGAEQTAPDSNIYNVYYDYVPLLYSTARFELTDFGPAGQSIKGLRLKFPAGQPVALAIDDIRLVKRPGQVP